MAGNHLKKFAFKSRRDAHSRAKRFHVCLDCLHNEPLAFKKCPKCNSANNVNFPSQVEFKRGMELLMLQSRGLISKLRFHTRFPLTIKNILITTYEDDADYYKNGVFIVEDSKFAGPAKYIEPLSIVKMRLVKALLGIEIAIPQQKATITKQKELFS